MRSLLDSRATVLVPGSGCSGDQAPAGARATPATPADPATQATLPHQFRWNCEVAGEEGNEGVGAFWELSGDSL